MARPTHASDAIPLSAVAMSSPSICASAVGGLTRKLRALAGLIRRNRHTAPVNPRRARGDLNHREPRVSPSAAQRRGQLISPALQIRRANGAMAPPNVGASIGQGLSGIDFFRQNTDKENDRQPDGNQP